MAHRIWNETKLQPGTAGARQHAWLLFSFFPFPVGHPVAAPCMGDPNVMSSLYICSFGHNNLREGCKKRMTSKIRNSLHLTNCIPNESTEVLACKVLGYKVLSDIRSIFWLVHSICYGQNSLNKSGDLIIWHYCML